MRIRKAPAAAIVAAALLVSSCSGDDESTDTSIRRIDRPQAATTTTWAATETTAAASGADLIAGGGAVDERARGEGRDTSIGETTAAPETTVAAVENEVRDTRFEYYGANPFEDPAREPLSTFAVDVDTGSYTLMRAWIEKGFLPDPDSVRVEEYVNYFDGGYAPPADTTFAVYADGGPTPFWGSRNDVLRIGLQAREVAERRRQDLNLTLVVDVSGSMSDQEKLTIVQDALTILVDELDRFDTVGIVAYNEQAQVVLEPTVVSDRDEILDAIWDLRAGGTTNAEAGVLLGYQLADESFTRDGVNRVVLLSDGVANVGNTGPEQILETIGDHSRRGIDLVTIGVGIETYNDVLLEQLADQGDGWYAYVDTVEEAENLFRDQLTTSFETVARDVKVQVEFDPDLVEEYRLIGFENRDISDDDFRDDDVDAGEINAGHSVTALYEVGLARDAYRSGEAFGTVRVRWTDAETGQVEEIDGDVHAGLLAARFDDSTPEFQLATTVAAYAEVLRDSRWVTGLDLEDVLDEADEIPWDELQDGNAEEFLDLLETAVRLGR